MLIVLLGIFSHLEKAFYTSISVGDGKNQTLRCKSEVELWEMKMKPGGEIRPALDKFPYYVSVITYQGGNEIRNITKNINF
jgi:hypothetical protein